MTKLEWISGAMEGFKETLERFGGNEEFAEFQEEIAQRH